MKNSMCLLFLMIACVFSTQAPPNQHLKIVITSYNNSAFYQKNLTTLLSQHIPDNLDVHTVYCDDNSSDGTFDLVEQFVAHHNVTKDFTLIANTFRGKPARNRYVAVHRYCHDNDIVAFYDGDDYLIDDSALQIIANAYHNPNVWLTYGNSRSTTHGTIKWCKPFDKHVIKRRLYRKSPWRTGHMRTCYAWLFKQIKLEDFLYQGAFLEMATDQAYMHPLLEMADGKLMFIHQEIYMHNEHNPLNMWHVNGKLQHFLRDVVLARKPYKRLPGKPASTTQCPTYCVVQIGSAVPSNRENYTHYVFVKNKQPDAATVQRAIEQLQSTHALVATLAEGSTRPGTQELKHCSYLWDSTFTWQFGWQPQLPLPYEPYAWLVPTAQYHKHTPILQQLMLGTLERTKLTKKLKEKAGLLMITNYTP